MLATDLVRADLDDLYAEAVRAAREFASRRENAAALGLAFGEDATSERVLQVIEEFERNSWPHILLAPAASLSGASAAYTKETNTIYLSNTFLAAADAKTLLQALVEEIGHAIDARLHAGDAPGDEGAIFARLVAGVDLTAASLAALKAAAPPPPGASYGGVTIDGLASDWRMRAGEPRAVFGDTARLRALRIAPPPPAPVSLADAIYREAERMLGVPANGHTA